MHLIHQKSSPPEPGFVFSNLKRMGSNCHCCHKASCLKARPAWALAATAFQGPGLFGHGLIYLNSGVKIQPKKYIVIMSPLPTVYPQKKVARPKLATVTK